MNYIMILHAEFRWIQSLSPWRHKIPTSQLLDFGEETVPSQVTQDICRLKRAFPTKPQLCKNGWATAVGKEAENWKRCDSVLENQPKSYESMKLDIIKSSMKWYETINQYMTSFMMSCSSANPNFSLRDSHLLLSPAACQFKKWPQKMCYQNKLKHDEQQFSPCPCVSFIA